jgi:hypothetical protein
MFSKIAFHLRNFIFTYLVFISFLVALRIRKDYIPYFDIWFVLAILFLALTRRAVDYFCLERILIFLEGGNNGLLTKEQIEDKIKEKNIDALNLESFEYEIKHSYYKQYRYGTICSLSFLFFNLLLSHYFGFGIAVLCLALLENRMYNVTRMRACCFVEYLKDIYETKE